MRALAALLLLVAACSGGSGSSSVTQPVTQGSRIPGVTAQACPHTRAPNTEPIPVPSSCHTDAECTEGQNGRCIRVSNHGGHGPSLEASTCSYDACFSDADCGAHGMCMCGSARSATSAGYGHVCTGGECDTDADCGAGKYCRRAPNGKYCHSLQDECAEERGCGPGQGCEKDASTGLYHCVDIGPILG